MSRTFRCPCGQPFKVAVPAGGIKVECPGCGKHLQLHGKPAPAANQPQSDPLFANLDAPSATLFPPGTVASNSPSTVANPFPKNSNTCLQTKNPGRENSKFFPIAIALGAGLPTLLFLAGLVAGFVEGPSDRHVSTNASTRSVSTVVSRAPAIPKSSTPVTLEEAEALAKSFQHELRSGSTAVANQMVHWESVVDRGLRGFDISDSLRRQFATGATKGLKNRNWANVIKTQTAGDVSLLRMRTKNGSPTALFRVKTVSGGLGYFEFEFYRDATEKVRIADVYVFDTGEKMSETIHRSAIPFIAHANRSFMDRLSGKESDYVKHQDKIGSMGQLLHSSPQAAMSAYRSLPVTLKKDKTVMLMRISITSNLDDESEYQAAVNDYMRTFPNDPAASLIAIDYYFFKDDVPATLKAIDKLDQMVGGDPALRVLEANVHMVKGDDASAKAALEKALQQDANYAEAKSMLTDLT